MKAEGSALVGPAATVTQSKKKNKVVFADIQAYSTSRSSTII